MTTALSIEKICNGIGEVSDALCSTVDFAKFNCSFGKFWRADDIGLLVVGGIEEAEMCENVSECVCFDANGRGEVVLDVGLLGFLLVKVVWSSPFASLMCG